MTTRRLSLLTLILAALALTLPALRIARADDNDGAPDIENSKFQAQGQINSNATYVHSGPGESEYPTTKLDKGAMVTVVGIRGDWLKIVPPAGSYCYVAKAWVEKHGDGTNPIGRVTNPLNVRVGSDLNAMKTKVAGRLDVGAEVTILGEEDEYFKIEPPKDVYLYVEKQYVDLIGNIAKNDAQPSGAQPTADQQATPSVTPSDATAQNTQNAPPAAPTDVVAAAATTQPAVGPASPAVAAAPATQPADSEADAENQFDALEKKYVEANGQPIDQQPLNDLQTNYAKLASSTVLPESLRRMCDYRVATLKQRISDQQQYLAVKKSQDDLKQKELSLKAESEELQARIAKSGIQYFTAVGTLRVSSLQQGQGTLYRLTDPNTGRTVVYVRSDDAKFAALTGQFIGVNGTVQDDQSLNLKIITPKDFSTVDQSKVNVTVASDIVPPSLMPGTSTASTSDSSDGR